MGIFDLFRNKNEGLVNAVKDNNINAAKKAIAAGADVNAKDEGGWTALMFASQNGHAEIVCTLIKAGADVNAKRKDGATALMRAALEGHTETVSTLIEAGADFNAKRKDGETALMRAALKGHTEIVSALIKAGAKGHVKRKDGVRRCCVCGMSWRSASGSLEDGPYGEFMRLSSVKVIYSNLVGLTCARCGKSFCNAHLKQKIPSMLPGGKCPSCGSKMSVS